MNNRIKQLVDRLRPEDRAAILSGFGCTEHELDPHRPRGPRPPKPAGPHIYRSCRITTSEGTFVRCAKPNCQDERHATMAALGIIR